MEDQKYIMSFIIIYLTMVQGVAQIDCQMTQNFSKNIKEVVDLKNPWYNCIQDQYAHWKEPFRELWHSTGKNMISRMAMGYAVLFNYTTAFL